MNAFIKSEIEKISSVIVQKPGLYHDNMHPDHIKEYLGDGNPNSEYLLFDDLIDTSLAIEEHNTLTNVIKQITGESGCLYLEDLISNLQYDMLEISPIPLPNLIFTRDIAITIGEKIISTWASKEVRNFENKLMQKVLNEHDLFSNTEIIYFNEIAPQSSLILQSISFD